MQTYSPDGVRQERTGWRDQAISTRHRAWGQNCPAIDIDFLMVEYNHKKPVAIVEYKDKHAKEPNLNDANYQALRALADGHEGRGIPFIIAFYCSTDWWFRIVPGNEIAVNKMKELEQQYGQQLINLPITEQWFVFILLRLRKDELEEQDKIKICEIGAKAANNCLVAA